MTYARSQIAPLDLYGCFHVVTPSVRRAFLCGSDQLTGKNFDHRRQHRQWSSCGFRGTRNKRMRNAVMRGSRSEFISWPVFLRCRSTPVQ